MSEALNDKEMRLLIALWVDGEWVKLPGEMRIAMSHRDTNSNSRFSFKIRDAKRLQKFGYVETQAAQIIMNMMTGKTQKMWSDTFRITKLGIMRLMDPKNVLITEVMDR